MADRDPRVDPIPIAKWSGTFDLFGVTMKCYVLEDGTAIIDADSVAELFNPDRMVTTREANLSPAEVDAEMRLFIEWMRGHHA